MSVHAGQGNLTQGVGISTREETGFSFIIIIIIINFFFRKRDLIFHAKCLQRQK